MSKLPSPDQGDDGSHRGNSDLDAILEPRISTIDLAGPRTPSSGPTRIIRTSGRIRIRAFDGTELAVYDPDALPVFSRRLAKDLKPGDRVCAFPVLILWTMHGKSSNSAQPPLRFLRYHRSVATATRLPGHNLVEKADALRNSILKIDPSLNATLPAGPQSIYQWIDVAGLVDAPRDHVRPQAPTKSRTLLQHFREL